MRNEEKEKKIIDNINMMLNFKRQENASLYLKEIAEYYDYLSENLNFPSLGSDLNFKLITCFESVWYTLQYYLKDIDLRTLTIIEEIFNKTNMLNFFSILAILIPNNGLVRYRRRKLFKSISFSVPSIFTINDNSNGQNIINSDTVLNIKAAIFRVANIVQTVSSEDFSEDIGLDKNIKTRYNPELIDKVKFLVLLELLKNSIISIPETEDTKILLNKIDIIEKEIKKKQNIKWGTVFAVIFSIFGFISSMRTIFPEQYDKAFYHLSRIITTIADEGQVNRESINKTYYLSDESKINKTEPFILPAKIKEEKNDDECE
jgi:hypothetical protein